MLGQTAGVKALAMAHRLDPLKTIAAPDRSVTPRTGCCGGKGKASLRLAETPASRAGPAQAAGNRYGFAWMRLLILQAAQAAPKPLSMLTVVTPLAQEVSIPKSAAMPEKAAP